MKNWLIILLLGASVATAVHGGSIIGTVEAEGKTDAAATVKAAGGAYDKGDERKLNYAPRVNYSELRDFVVYIEGGITNKFDAPFKPVMIETRHVTQQGALFSPHVLPVLVGTKVEWPNNDTVYHNVFSMSEAATFDLGLYKHGDKPQSVTFDKPGRVDVFCSIHANMNCIILALDNPYFAPTDGRNHYLIANVPAGTYKLKAWHERVPSQVKEVTVPEKGEVRVDFKLGWPSATGN
ncbi:MAG: hypothetical protein RLZZ350_554 [Verrucomicrobiota bacterium]|jgi:plastocyanin